MNRKDRRRAAKETERQPAGRRPGPLAAGPRDASRLVAQAIPLHQMGRLAEAERLYRQALALAPKEPDALHFLGLVAHQKGDNAQAIALIERAIAEDDTVAAYHSNLGETYRAIGRLADAVRAYRHALAIQPGMTDARYGLGTALLGEKKYADAAAALTAVIRAEPNDANAHMNLGNALAELGRNDEAIRHYERARTLRPDFAEAHFNLGIALKTKGELRAAYESLARAIELMPTLAEAHFWIGTVLADMARPDDAAAALGQALALKPDMLRAQLALGDILRAAQKTEEALACYERARVLAPDDLAPINGIGQVHLERGEFEEARRWFAKALEQDLRAADAYFNMGLSYQLQGRFEEAFPWHEKAIALEPDNAGAHYNLVKSKKFGSDDDRIRQIERVLAMETLTREQRVGLNFALAKAYDDIDDYDAAFRHYKAGNDLKAATLEFAPKRFTDYVDRVIATFSTEFFARMGAPGSDSELPVFIVGMPRSGTTLVEQILATHPQVHGAGELDYMRQIVHALPGTLGSERPFPECVGQLDQPLARQIAEEHLARLRQHDRNALRITDKMPNNFQRLGVIALLFPRARIIHCVRDPLDTCLSCYFQEFAHGQPFAYRLDHLGRVYRDYERLMAHWHAALPSRILDIPYEALVADQEGWSRKLVDFLGLPWDDRCLAFHKNDRLVRTASFWQVRQPIYSSSIGRWRHYVRHLGPLFDALGIVPPGA